MMMMWTVAYWSKIIHKIPNGFFMHEAKILHAHSVCLLSNIAHHKVLRDLWKYSSNCCFENIFYTMCFHCIANSLCNQDPCDLTTSNRRITETKHQYSIIQTQIQPSNQMNIAFSNPTQLYSLCTGQPFCRTSYSYILSINKRLVSLSAWINKKYTKQKHLHCIGNIRLWDQAILSK